MVQAPSDNFWVLLSKAHFNTLVSESGKDIHKPLLLTEITGSCLLCKTSIIHDFYSQMARSSVGFYAIQTSLAPSS